MEFLKYLVFVLWGMLSFYTLIGLLGLLYKPHKTKYPNDNVSIVIVSIANHMVKSSLLECINHTRNIMKGKKIYCLIDAGCSMEQELNLLGEIELVVVPQDYRNDLVGKGRSLNYFVENIVDRNIWYAFIDDDNLILDDRFLYEIPYYESKNILVANPILKARMGKSSIAFVMDGIRFFDDSTIFRFFTGLLGKPLKGLHGELLIVKGKVLKEIGFNFNSIVEDFRFSQEVLRHGYKTWQSNTVVSIKSPNSIADLFRQRIRWISGIISDFRYCPPLMKANILFLLPTLYLSLLTSWIFSPLWFLYFGTFLPAIPGGLYYIGAYLYAIWISRKYYLILLTPIFSILESLAMMSGLLKKKGEFVVIDKN